MLKQLTVSLLVYLSVIAPSLLASQINTPSEQFQFKRLFSDNDRLKPPIQTVFMTIQDKDGFIWFATSNGLVRYDSYDTKTFQPSADGQSISSQMVWALAVDHDGGLWVGTENGLNHYNPKTEQFTQYYHIENKADSLAHNRVRTLVVDANNQILCGTSKGLSVLNEERTSFTNYSLMENTDTLFVSDLFIDSNQFIWAGTTDQGVFKLNPDFSTANHYHAKAKSGLAISGNYISSIMEDAEGSIWLASLGNGLDKLKDGESAFKITNDLGDPNFTGNVSEIVDIYKDSKNNLWLSTNHHGLYFLSHKTQRVTSILHDTIDQTTISSNMVQGVYEDRQGDIWVGTYREGINFLNVDLWKFKNLRANHSNPNTLPESAILSIHPERDQFWIGTEGGLSLYNPSYNSFKNYTKKDGDKNSLQANAVLAIEEATDNKLWVGTWYGGLHLFDKKTEHFKHYTLGKSSRQIKREFIWDILRTRSNKIWVATELSGVMIYDDNQDEFVNFTPKNHPKGKNYHKHIWTLLEDSHGEIWIGSMDGLWRYKPDSDSFQYYFAQNSALLGNRIISLHEDTNQNIWIGSFENGVSLFDRRQNQIIPPTFNDILPSKRISSIIQDLNGDVWFTTNRGLVRLNLADQSIRTFSKSHGLAGDIFVRNNAYRSPGGDIYVGSTQGLSIFSPNNFKDQVKKANELAFTDFKVLNKSVKPTPNNTNLPLNINHIKSVKLDYKENVFSLYFSALNFRSNYENHYTYKLEGFDKEWNNIGNATSATYTNLDPGHYRFLVKTSTQNMALERNAKSVTIHISPPWWKTWWAYSIYLFIILSILALIAFTLWKQKEAENTRKVNARLKEIDRIKDAFLANTSHELRTPLNGIIGIAESVIDGAAGPITPKISENLQMIADSGNRLARLVNDILDFSKLRNHAIRLDRQEINLRMVCDEVILLLKPTLKAKPVSLINHIDNELIIHADKDRLQQIFHNLIGNAIKFTQKGSIEISAQAHEHCIWISISDTGCGIEESNFESIFNSFEQANNDENHAHGGTGLGLAVTKQLINLHGGTIELSSQIGLGTTFRFSLPNEETIPSTKTPFESNQASKIHKEIGQHNIDSHAIAKDVLAPPQVPLSAEFSKSLASNDEAETGLQLDIHDSHILVVDDEVINRQVLRNILSLQNFRLTEAEDGKEALDILSKKENDIDLVLLDVMMPELSGYEVCAQLRQNYSRSQLPVIFLTAKNLVKDLQTGYECGANDFLAKPIAKEELLARVDTHLQLLKINRYLEDLVEARTQELVDKHENLKQAQSQLVHSEKMAGLGTLVAGIGHEINNPMTYSHMAIENLARELMQVKNYVLENTKVTDTDDYLKQFECKVHQLFDHIETALDGSNRIKEIISNLKTFSRLDEPEMQPALVQPGLESTINLVKTNYKHEVIFNSDIHPCPEVLCTPSELNQVFINLIVNACQAIIKSQADKKEREPGLLNIKLYKEANSLIVSFEDNGVGMPEEVKRRMFDPFYTTKPDGTGLGLSVTHGIIERHQGTINVESEIGMGTTISIALPFYEED